jgi:ATP/maltotriose-dependent transcriptional regulator MalT
VGDGGADPGARWLAYRRGRSARRRLFEPNLIYQAGRAALAEGDLDRAEDLYARAEDAANRTASRLGLGFAFFGKASLSLARGHLMDARRFADDSLAIDALVLPSDVIQDLYLLVLVCAAQGDREGLTSYAAELDAAAQRAASPRERALAHVAAGLVAVADGRATDAEPLFMAAIETFAAIPIVYCVAEAVGGLATCATVRGDLSKANRLNDLAAGLLDGSRAVESVLNALD